MPDKTNCFDFEPMAQLKLSRILNPAFGREVGKGSREGGREGMTVKEKKTGMRE